MSEPTPENGYVVFNTYDDMLAAVTSGADLDCQREHRAPQGPNEDIAQCVCWRPTFALRPVGETFGRHLPDCSLPERHLSYCQPGGAGHPDAPLIRG